MNGVEIEFGLQGSLGKKIRFLGCYWIDDIPRLLNLSKNYPSVFILNTLSKDDKTSVLGHWIALYVNYMDGTLGYFDSYNLDPKHYSIPLHDFIQSSPHITVYRLSYRLQGIHSVVCGIYTMLFSHLLSHYNITSSFSYLHKIFKRRQFTYYDKLVTRMVYRLFKMPSCEKTFCLQGDIGECKALFCKEVM